MREGVISASWLSEGAWAREREAERTAPEKKASRSALRWNPETFAWEQIRGLVRQVFLRLPEAAMRQVVFSAVDAEADVSRICRCVGETLALEVPEDVAVIGGPLTSTDERRGTAEMEFGRGNTRSLLRQRARRLRSNLWLVPAHERRGACGGTASLLHFLGEIHSEFTYSIVVAPPAGVSDEATAMAQLADGMILVLSAKHTRRVTAARIRERLAEAHVHVLGAVLADREFPIPESVYRRL